MAIIRASKTFEGGEFKQNGGNYIKPGIRMMNFRDKTTIDGTYVFILGAYKEDSEGNGVWYKPLKIRDNFGLDTKEKFAVPANCPIDYFANKIKTFAPNLAKPEKVKREDGKEMNVYPAFGRTTWRVLYNAAYFNNLGLGAHVLDLPLSGGASVIDEYVRGKQPDGSDNPLLNDYQASIPVYIKLDLKANGQPWKIQINNNKTYPLPESLADTEFIYNLDEVVTYPSKQELIDKLKMIVPSDLFNKGMAGYSDGSVTISMATPAAVKQSAAAPELPVMADDDLPFAPTANPVRATKTPTPIPASVIPTASKPQAQTVAPAFNLPKANIPTTDTDDDLPRSPIASTSGATMEAAKQFLRKPAVA